MIRKTLQQLKELFFANIHKPALLAKSVAIGVYVAFCPFIGLHTLLIFLAGWFFSLSIPIMFVVCLLLHNPWTMVFIYSAGYLCGSCIYTLFRIQHTFLDGHIEFLLQYIPYFHIPPEVCMKFFVGGNLLGIFGAFLLYILVKQYAIRYNEQHKTTHLSS